jgi:hypothetical protein
VCGAVLSVLACSEFSGASIFLGVLAGLLTTCGAALGWAGTARRGANLLAAQFVCGLLALELIFALSAATQRAKRVDCALAELLLLDDRAKAALEAGQRGKEAAFGSVQLRLVRAPHASLARTLLPRPLPSWARVRRLTCLMLHAFLQEALDATLELLETRADLATTGRPADREAAGAALAAEHQRALWAASDARLIASKLARAKEHGMQLVYQLFKHGAAPEGRIKALQAAAAERLSPADAEELQRRYDALFADVEHMLDRIRQHEDQAAGGGGGGGGGGGREVRGDEYVELLSALEGSMRSMGEFVRRVEVAAGREGLPLTHDGFLEMMRGVELEGGGGGGPAAAAAPGPRPRPLAGLRGDADAVAAALARQQDGGAAYDSVRSWDVGALKASWRRGWEAEFAAGLPGDGSEAVRDLPGHW